MRWLMISRSCFIRSRMIFLNVFLSLFVAIMSCYPIYTKSIDFDQDLLPFNVATVVVHYKIFKIYNKLSWPLMTNDNISFRIWMLRLPGQHYLWSCRRLELHVMICMYSTFCLTFCLYNGKLLKYQWRHWKF